MEFHQVLARPVKFRTVHNVEPMTQFVQNVYLMWVCQAILVFSAKIQTV